MSNRSSRRKFTSGIRTLVVQISRKLKATYRIRRGRLFSRLLAALLGVYSGFVLALPQGMDVKAGSVVQDAVSTLLGPLLVGKPRHQI